VQLRWTPSEPWEFSLLASGQRFNDTFVPTFAPNSDPDPFHVWRDFPGHVDTETWNAALKVAWRNDAVRLTSVTSYRHWEQDLAQDFDFTAFDPAQPPSPANPPPTVGFFRPHLRQWTEEVRVRSLADASAWKWNAGLYFAATDTDSASGRRIDLAPPLVVDTSLTEAAQEARTYALFGETAYTVRERLDLIAGLRLTYDERRLQRLRRGVNYLDAALPPGPFLTGDFAAHDQFSAAQPKLGLAYHFQPECQMYFTASSGYQSGGFNAANDQPEQSRFTPARSWHYELGVRTLWQDRRIEFNTALFYITTDGYQVYRLSATDPAQAWMLNAERTSSWGAEADLAVRPTESLAVSLAAGYTAAQFDRFDDPYNQASFDGHTINFVPEFTATLAAEYRFARHFHARAEVVGVGKFYLDEANSAAQSPYALLHLRLGYARGHFEMFVFGANLLDEQYASNALDFRPFSGLIRQPGDPRQWGVGLSARF